MEQAKTKIFSIVLLTGVLLVNGTALASGHAMKWDNVKNEPFASKSKSDKKKTKVKKLRQKQPTKKGPRATKTKPEYRYVPVRRF